MKLRAYQLWCFLLWMPALGQAADIKFRGFASVVAGSTFSSDETLYGYDDTFSFKPDSLAALQADANLRDNLTATMQIMARGRDDYDAAVEWAYLTYQFSDEVQLSAGRIRIPFYRYSDFIDVRYSYHWIKVPQTVYGFEFPGYDGFSLVLKNNWGSWDSSLQIIGGQLDAVVGSNQTTLENLVGVNWTVNPQDWLTLRAGYMQSKVNIALQELAPLENLLNNFGLRDAASHTIIDGDMGSFMGFAVGIDRNNIVLDAEYISYEVEESILPETSAYYLSLGYRFNEFIPYISYSQQKADPNQDLYNEIPPQLAATPLGANQPTLGMVIQGAIASQKVDTELKGVGFRYDFHPSAAFKLGYESQETLTHKDNVLRIAVDLVY